MIHPNLLAALAATLSFAAIVLPSPTSASQLKETYNIVVLGNTGVGKSSLLNMFAGQEPLFVVGDNAVSETQVASSKVHRFLGKADGVQLRLVDTQGLSDTGGDSKDMSHIKNMVEYIKRLEHIDMFIICFDGMNPRFTAYAQSTISLFSQIFPDFLYHSVIVFNKWNVADKQRQINLRREYQNKIRNDYGMDKIPCYFIDSFFNRKMLRDNDDGTETVRYLHPNIQERTLSQLIELMNYLVLKGTTCDVRNIEPKDTEKTALIKDKEAAAQELESKRTEFENNMKELKEQNDKKLQEAQEASAKEMQQLREQIAANQKKSGGIFGDLLSIFVPIVPVLAAAFGK